MSEEGFDRIVGVPACLRSRGYRIAEWAVEGTPQLRRRFANEVIATRS